MQALCHKVTDAPGNAALLFRAACNIPHLTDFLQFVPCRFFALAVGCNEQHLFADVTIFIRQLFNRTGQKFVLILPSGQKPPHRCMTAMTGQNLVLAVRQRCYNKVA